VSRSPALLAALAVLAVALVLLAQRTARRPEQPVPDLAGYFEGWQALHGGYDPRTGSAWLRGWLTMVHAVARPLATRGVQPDVLTVSSLWLAGLVVVLADVGGRWCLLSGAVLVLSGLSDNLDGAVAVMERRSSRWGYVLDSVVDRVSDAAYLVAAVLLGCPGWLAACCGFAVFFLEYVRARSGNAGGGDVGVVTMAERPTRVLLLSPAVVLGGVFLSVADVLATAATAVLLALTAIASVQLLVVVRRRLLAL
jgi:phosphatidylglycerophosphate synthase